MNENEYQKKRILINQQIGKSILTTHSSNFSNPFIHKPFISISSPQPLLQTKTILHSSNTINSLHTDISSSSSSSLKLKLEDYQQSFK